STCGNRIPATDERERLSSFADQFSPAARVPSRPATPDRYSTHDVELCGRCSATAVPTRAPHASSIHAVRVRSPPLPRPTHFALVRAEQDKPTVPGLLLRAAQPHGRRPHAPANPHL